MSPDNSIILVFEPRAILAGRTRDWSQFHKLGTCLIPQVVLEELEFLTNRAVEPEEEKIAREFCRFFPESGWQVSNYQNTHPSFQHKQGENMSKSAGLQMAISESVYGIATDNLDQLVVLVANQSNLRNDIDNIGQDNLTTLPLTRFIQWLRTQQKPVNVSQKLQNFNCSGNNSTPVTGITNSPKKKYTSSTNKSSSQSSSGASAKVKKKKSNPLTPIISTILALGGFVVVGSLVWYMVQPNSFQQFWQKTGLPSLPSK